MSVFILSIGFGIVTASVLALATIGLTLQMGVTNYVNFAYGEFLTLGAYFALTLNRATGLSFWLCMVAGAILVGAVGVLLNQVLLRPFVKKGSHRLFLLVVTFGLSLILSNVVLAVWGSGFQSFNLPHETPFHVGPFLFTRNQLLIVGIAVVVVIGVHLLLTRTRIGKAMRAMSDNADLARISGIDTDRVTTYTWMLSGVMAGLAGIVLAINVTSFQPSFGGEFLFVIFSAMILGGVGSPYGAILGAIAVGLVTEMSAVVLSSAYKNDVAFAVLILMLLLRPQGLIRMAGKA